jgi:ABC-type amino acid transport substrate-binding protein
MRIGYPSSTGAVRVRTRKSQGARPTRVWTLVAVLWLVGCASTPPTGLGGLSEPLRVGITPNYPPLVFRTDDGFAGIEPDLARLAASELGRRPEFVELEWDALIPSLEAHEIDVIMSGMSITPERKSHVLFTTPYMGVGQLALIRRANVRRLGSPEAIRRPGASVGYVRHTTGAEYVGRVLSRADSYAFDSVEDGLRSLRAGRIEYFVHDAPTAWRVALAPDEDELMGLYHPLTREQLAWAVAKDDATLKNQLDAILDAWRAHNRLGPILDRWIPVRVSVRE